MDRSIIRTTVAVLALVAIFAAGHAQATGNPANGKTLFVRCAVCHKTAKDAGNGLGPNLFAIGGRKAGTVASFAYSDAMKNSAITWSEEKLEAYITNPKAVVPGNRMAFAGLSNPAQVNDIVAYLMSLK